MGFEYRYLVAVLGQQVAGDKPAHPRTDDGHSAHVFIPPLKTVPVSSFPFVLLRWLNERSSLNFSSPHPGE
jgi:hypothetical protein